MSAVLAPLAWAGGMVILAGLVFGAGYLAAWAFRSVGRHK